MTKPKQGTTSKAAERWALPSSAEPFRPAAAPAEAAVSDEGAQAAELTQPSGSLLVVTVPADEENEVQFLDVGYIHVRGVRFQVEAAEDEVHLTHPLWSLAGSGATLAEAEIELMREAAELAEVMVDLAPAELDENATALRTFALAFLGTRFPQTSAA